MRARLLRCAVLVLVLALTGCASTDPEEAVAGPDSPADTGRPVVPEAGPPWSSGVWLGGAQDAGVVTEFGRWRGGAVDSLTVYPAYDTWAELASSDWHVSTFSGFDGRLVYGLPLLPSGQEASLREVADGTHDDVWRSVASHLLESGRSDSFVRVGLEANGTWFPWGATAETTDDYQDAFRHVVEILDQEAPDLQVVFDLSCGVALTGAEDDRLAALERLYPGDDVVDVVGCDHYDSYSAIARTEAQWEQAIAPVSGPGLADVVAFARQRGKTFAVPEWGLTSSGANGAGDNPFFIRKMHEFFTTHQDVLAFENYFDEPDTYLGSALFLAPQNPRSARLYRSLW